MKEDMKKLCVLAVSVFLCSCGHGEGEYDATGIFEATEVTVSSEVSGRIEKFSITEGMDVVSSEELGLVDTTQLHLNKLQLLAANDAISSRMVDVDLQMASLREQIATAESEYERFNALLKTGAVSRKQVEDIESQVMVLKSELDARQQQLNGANASLSGESRAGYIQISQINDMINRSIIKSPISGKIISTYVDRGELAIQGRPIFKVADVRHMFIRAYLTSDQLFDVKIGDAVTVCADFGNGKIREYEGTLVWISDSAEFTPKTILTSNERANLVYAVKIAFENDGYAKIGMYGGIKFRK